MSSTHIFNPSRLVVARKRRAMTRHSLTIALDLPSVAALGRIERGERKPADDLVAKMAHVLYS